MRFQVGRAHVRDEEGWAQAADRVAAALDLAATGPVLAVDLSGDPLLFRVPVGERIAVRPFTPGDLPQLARWFAADHVRDWWQQRRSGAEFDRHYRSLIDEAAITRLWVWEVNGRSIGFSQVYRIADHPEYAALCRRPDAVGIDYLVGEPAFLRRGLGTALVWVFLRDIVHPRYPEVVEVFAAPDHRNLASLRVLEKLGFAQGAWFDERRPDGSVSTVVGCSLDVPVVLGRPVTGE